MEFLRVRSMHDRCDSNFERCDSNFEPCDSNFEPCDSNFEPCDSNFERCDSKFELCDSNFERFFFFNIQRLYIGSITCIASFEHQAQFNYFIQYKLNSYYQLLLSQLK